MLPTDAVVARKLEPHERARSDWRVMVRDARVCVKGAVRHPDHATIWLPEWHEVVMNTETRAASNISMLLGEARAAALP